MVILDVGVCVVLACVCGGGVEVVVLASVWVCYGCECSRRCDEELEEVCT